ncbi:girdin isoform X1 [Drosophila guanche]|uniref:Blast:Girdin n=1 Tax=Drosophila guanche TaxID=7266 RepID=A0A3B0JS63_DROGU|nr:girdin isoform X1 [Drosophila guanche]SPP76206.1 blast:Girdin [Drosophila guanche]
MAGTAAATPMEIDEFINGALVSWLESCLPRAELLAGYTSLLDGHIIHSVWLQIDPEPQNNPSALTEFSGKSLSVARAKNFECIVRNLKSLFEEELGQTILVLPDAVTLGYHPESRNGLEQMKTLLTLLLGAAVQCPNKELFIARIKELDLETQHAIVALIKQVTDSHSLVLTEDSLERLSPQNMYTHILRLTKERDVMYLKWIDLVCMEPEMTTADNLAECGQGVVSVPRSPSNGTATSTPSSSSNSDSNHLAVECADLRSKNRKLRQELEEKSENLLELREELDEKNVRFDRLRQDSQDWFSEAKRASAYRDEVDILRERAERADRLEVEVQKYREKLGDSDFYKSRVEELREDNRVLLESKEMLEEQLQRYRKRSEHAISLESEIIKYKQKLNDMALERDVDRSKLEELLEENAQLQLVARNLNSTHEGDKSFSENEDDCNSGDNSLSEQLTNNAQTRALKLELENRRLTAALEQLKESSFHESTNKMLELEKEKKKLSLKIDQMQENIQRLSQQNVELEGVFKNALEENKKLQDAVDSRQKSYDRQSLEREVDRQRLADAEQHAETLNKEKQRIQTLNESIQRRADDLERLAESKNKELEQHSEKAKQYEQTKQRLYEIEAKVSAYERENASLLKEVSKLKEGSEEKSVQLDQSINQLDTQTKEIMRLSKVLEETEQVQQKLIELEKQNQELASQRNIDQEMINTLREDLVTGTLVTKKVRHNLAKLGLTDSEPTELNVEHVVEKLVRNPETFKTVREIMLNVKREQQEERYADEEEGEGGLKSDMCVLCHRQEIFTVEKNIELAPTSSSQELRFEHKRRPTPVRESAELMRVKDCNTQLQTENARLSVDVAALGSQITSLNTQHVALQLANSQLAAEKDTLLKDIDSLQQVHKNALQDQVTLQCLHDQLSAEYESLNKDKEQLKAAVRDLRQELRDTREQQTALEQRIEELTTQNGSMKTCSEDLSILRTEHSKLTDDFRNLFATSDRFKNEYKNIQEQYKMIRMEHSSLKLQNTELSGELNTRSDQVRLLQMEYSKLQQRCEMLIQNNGDLDSERKALMDNVSQLLSQYQELLAISLEDKKHFHEEEKNYTERVHSLKRQKEKLEEKIMEHYKKSETTVHKKKPFAISLVRRVKKASSDLMNKVPSRNRRSWVDDARTNSQFVIGSESGGNESDNSNEEPLSVASDTHLLQRNMPLRQSLQRDLLDNSIQRGGAVRSSLQAQKRTDLNNSRRNSVHGSLEAPDVTGSSLTLGTAGSRRTVYLIDEHQKLPDGSNSSPGSNAQQQQSASTSIASDGTPTPKAEPQTPQKNNENNSNISSPGPATFLMYNRINTTIGGVSTTTDQNPLVTTEASGSGGGNVSVTPTQDDKSGRKRSEDKSNSIWYEYGCV